MREYRVRFKAGAVDIVNKVQKPLRQVDVLLHQSG
jgi:hypothetical protein